MQGLNISTSIDLVVFFTETRSFCLLDVSQHRHLGLPLSQIGTISVAIRFSPTQPPQVNPLQPFRSHTRNSFGFCENYTLKQGRL